MSRFNSHYGVETIHLTIFQYFPSHDSLGSSVNNLAILSQTITLSRTLRIIMSFCLDNIPRQHTSLASALFRHHLSSACSKVHVSILWTSTIVIHYATACSLRYNQTRWMLRFYSSVLDIDWVRNRISKKR